MCASFRRIFKDDNMDDLKFIGFITLLGAAFGSSVAMLLGIVLYRDRLGVVLLIGAGLGLVCGLIAGIICMIIKKNAQR